MPETKGAMRPVKRGNSVVEADFGVFFDVMPDPDVILKIARMRSKLKSEYPRVHVQHSDKWQFINDRELYSGIEFALARPDGEHVREIRLWELDDSPAGSVLTVRRRDYTSWGSTWSRGVKRELALILPPLLATANISKFELRFHRKFVWEGKSSLFRGSKLFRKDSPHLPPAMHAGLAQWLDVRINQIWQLTSEHNVPVFSCLQIDQDAPPVHEKQDAILIDVMITHSALLDRPWDSNSVRKTPHLSPPGKYGIDALFEHFDELHTKNLQLLASVVNDEICKAIGLERAR